MRLTRLKDEIILVKEKNQEQVKTIIRKCNAKSYNKLSCYFGLRLYDLLKIARSIYHASSHRLSYCGPH